MNYQERVNPEDLKAAWRDNTVLVFLIYRQSEIGTVQAIAELGKITKIYGALFYVNTLQVAGGWPMNVRIYQYIYWFYLGKLMYWFIWKANIYLLSD